MASDEKMRPVRDRTDASLRAERAKMDEALAEQQAAVEADATRVLERARETADALLVAARGGEDERAAQGAAPASSPAAVAVERAAEDEVVREERAAADELLERQRDAVAALTSRLLPGERQATDAHLLTERAHSDDAVANRDDFLVIVSHDLRNLLGGITLSAAVLTGQVRKEHDDGAWVTVEAKRIQRFAARMNRLIGDLLDVASIDAGRLDVRPVRADAAALLAEAVEVFDGAASAKSIELEIAGGAQPLLAELDHDRMMQVLANLVTNAIKFTPGGGRIVLRGDREGERILLSVEDTGAGVPDGMLEKIFERFRQVGERDRRGLGLGLHISKYIVEAHGGRIWAESKLGEGSRFVVALPAAPVKMPG